LHEPAIRTVGVTSSSSADGRHLVRHRDERAADVAEAEEQLQELRILLGLHAHRDHDRVDARLLEVRVVDHRRLERLGRVAEMRDQGRPAADHRYFACAAETAARRPRR
jgi:hypothetical protein